MSEKITITWEARDGYVGGAAPQYFDINPEDFFGLSESELENALVESVEDDFREKVSWSCDLDKVKEQIKDAERAAEAREEDEP